MTMKKGKPSSHNESKPHKEESYGKKKGGKKRPENRTEWGVIRAKHTAGDKKK